MLEELLWRQIARLPPIENRVGDIRREIAEADKTSEIGRAHAFAFDKRSKGNVVAADEGRAWPDPRNTPPAQIRSFELFGDFVEPAWGPAPSLL